MEDTNPASNNEFGMSSEELKSYKRSAFLGRIKYYFSAIEPAFVKILNAFLYYTIRFLKAFVTAIVRMVMGKEV